MSSKQAVGPLLKYSYRTDIGSAAIYAWNVVQEDGQFFCRVLTEAEADRLVAERAARIALEAQVAKLTEERDELNADVSELIGECQRLECEKAGARASALEEAAALCDAEEANRLANMRAAAAGSHDWGYPKQAELAQGHKAITAQNLADRIRALKPAPSPEGEIAEAIRQAPELTKQKRVAQEAYDLGRASAEQTKPQPEEH